MIQKDLLCTKLQLCRPQNMQRLPSTSVQELAPPLHVRRWRVLAARAHKLQREATELLQAGQTGTSEARTMLPCILDSTATGGHNVGTVSKPSAASVALAITLSCTNCTESR